MPRFTVPEIREIFSSSRDFNDLLEAFQEALALNAQDLELYRPLFWNPGLSPDEVCLFGEKLAKEFPALAFDTYVWLAKVFEMTFASYDNFELAMKYYRKASLVKPEESGPYLGAADCFDPNISIPPPFMLIQFLREGLRHVTDKRDLLDRIAYLFEMIGDMEQSEHYRKLSDDLRRSKN
jgi:tetratricopeptide (TPR) repeat protein